jgi:hypothetical protein
MTLLLISSALYRVPPDMEIHEIIDDDAVQDVTTAFNLQVSKCKMFIFSVTILRN